MSLRPRYIGKSSSYFESLASNSISSDALSGNESRASGLKAEVVTVAAQLTRTSMLNSTATIV
jgi:hypothetical protein